jgi:hypothetical protein
MTILGNEMLDSKKRQTLRMMRARPAGKKIEDNKKTNTLSVASFSPG